MKRLALLSPPRTTTLGLGVLSACALSACQLAAQTGGYYQPAAQTQNPVDTFYQRGDAMSERVSGFMRRIFGGGQRQQPTYNQPVYTQPPASGAYRPAPTSQPPPISNYERPSSNPSTGTGIYGYNSQPATKAQQKPAQPASRTAATPRKPLFGSSARTTPPAPTQSRSTTYTPPQINEQPANPAKPQAETPPQPAPAPKKETTDVNDFLPPGTVVKNAPEQPKSTDSSLTKPSEPAKDSAPPPPLPPASTTTSDGTPVGKKGSKPNRVISPYPPNNELDVTGLESGSLALDPTTNKVFKVP